MTPTERRLFWMCASALIGGLIAGAGMACIWLDVGSDELAVDLITLSLPLLSFAALSACLPMPPDTAPHGGSRDE